jgi:hypothetical protein
VRYLLPSLTVLFCVIAFSAYAYLSYQQLIDVIRHQPGCFPPYMLMNQQVRHAPQGAYRQSSIPDDEGVRSLAVRSTANRSNEHLEVYK